MQFTDTVTVAGARRRDDGALLAEARIARTGIQLYLGSEVGRPEFDRVRVYRPGAEVFSRETMASAAHRPVTNDHPPELVTSANWKTYAVGNTADEVTGEAVFIRVPLMVSDGAAVADIQAGKRELSAGYTCDLDFTPGVTEAGEAYDAIQKNIRLNHVAIVRRGRAGSQVRIGDGAASWGIAPITADERTPDMPDTLRTVMVDGQAVSTTGQGAEAIESLKSALMAKDEEIGALKAGLTAAREAAHDLRDLDALVAARSELVAAVQAIDARIEVSGRSDAELRRAAVTARLGEEMTRDASDAEVCGMFKAISRAAKPATASGDPFAGAVRDGLTGAATPATAYRAMTVRLTSAWQTPNLNSSKGAA
ncbi:hypothetical protein AEAC466_13420 [Asticcacaulis sp. AC466]|uniref:DUF2213 domain-containing protein n=1 Tax=Asticcacaulis sp. AC466 TaxID=1282362 RepID=UPI0003C400C0|nr:DUF2213 domain-containing protein [Asticcacaulis sp. AC466]ESQ83246.1 hypothetical protein AEAC466_13420 [Asticcacaulis sp. AC466]